MSNPLGNFAAAASAKGGNPKISSAELLSMLKKPSVSASSTSASSASGSAGVSTNTITVPTTSTTSTNTATAPSIEKPISSIKDDYSLHSLVDLIKSCPSDRNIFSIGVDLERTGLAFNQSEPLRESLTSPWFDGSFESLPSASTTGSSLLGMNRVAGGSTSGRSTPPPQQSQSLLLQGRRPSTLESIIPTCYLVPSIPAPAGKIASFADETLFYIFYSMPGDRMQDSAARELNSRGWRFHKPTKSWIKEDKDAKDTKDSFFQFDQSAWIKVKRQFVLQANDLEESRAPISNQAAPSNNVVMHGSGTLQSHSVTH